MTPKKTTDKVRGEAYSLRPLPFVCEIVRARRKTLSLIVKRTGEVVLRAPMRCSLREIDAFLTEKSAWVMRQIERIHSAMPIGGVPHSAADGVVFPLFGEDTTIVLRDDRFGKKAELCGVKLYLPSGRADEALNAFLRRTAKEYLEKRCAYFAEKMSVAYKSVSVTAAKTRWGSCSFDNRLNFPYRLVYARKDVVDYVVIHELSHVVEKNHSAAFWAIVEKYCPDYREKRAFLKEHAYYTDVF